MFGLRTSARTVLGCFRGSRRCQRWLHGLGVICGVCTSSGDAGGARQPAEAGGCPDDGAEDLARALGEAKVPVQRGGTC